MKWSLFQKAMISPAVDKSGLGWRRVERKEHLGGTYMVKKLPKRSKMHLRPCCKRVHHISAVINLQKAQMF